MRISQLLKLMGNTRKYPVYGDFEVRGVTCNSKAVEEDFVFVAVKGSRHDGSKFIGEAVKKGARVVVSQSAEHKAVRSPEKAIFIRVKDVRLALARLASEFYGNPSRKMKVVGVTGTNGKTTITYLAEAVLKESGFLPGVIGTINYRFKDNAYPSKNTTPGPVELQSMLSEMAGAGVNYCVMEASSHALHQGRTLGINFHSAIFTNLTQDHLDYHRTLESYFRAKARLFMDIKPSAVAVINSDDDYGMRLPDMTRADVVTYGIKNSADVRALDIRYSVSGTEFTVDSKKGVFKIKTPLIGRHNVYNILAVFAWALEEHIEPEKIVSAIEKFGNVPGRLERIEDKKNVSVFVDYAHTEDALKNIITSLREVSRKKIIVVFGCGGDRDRGKRPKMGRVVTELADQAIITNDNPRSEDPADIIREIRQGISRDNYCVIQDRKKAIKKSLSLARPGDVVLVAGKGHEDYQIIKDKILRFDDREVVRECLQSRKS